MVSSRSRAATPVKNEEKLLIRSNSSRISGPKPILQVGAGRNCVEALPRGEERLTRIQRYVLGQHSRDLTERVCGNGARTVIACNSCQAGEAQMLMTARPYAHERQETPLQRAEALERTEILVLTDRKARQGVGNIGAVRRGHLPKGCARGSVWQRCQLVFPPVLVLMLFEEIIEPIAGLVGRDRSRIEKQAPVGQQLRPIFLAAKQIEQEGIRRHSGVERDQQIESRDQSVGIESQGGKLLHQLEMQLFASLYFVKYQWRQVRTEASASLDDVRLFPLGIDLEEVDSFPTVSLQAVVEGHQPYGFAGFAGLLVSHQRIQLRVVVDRQLCRTAVAG